MTIQETQHNKIHSIFAKHAAFKKRASVSNYDAANIGTNYLTGQSPSQSFVAAQGIPHSVTLPKATLPEDYFYTDPLEDFYKNPLKGYDPINASRLAIEGDILKARHIGDTATADKLQNQLTILDNLKAKSEWDNYLNYKNSVLDNNTPTTVTLDDPMQISQYEKDVAAAEAAANAKMWKNIGYTAGGAAGGSLLGYGIEKLINKKNKGIVGALTGGAIGGTAGYLLGNKYGSYR